MHSDQWGELSEERTATLVYDVDGMNMAVRVTLSGGTGDRLARVVRDMRSRYPDRLVVFATSDFDGIGHPDFRARTIRPTVTEADMWLPNAELHRRGRFGATAVGTNG